MHVARPVPPAPNELLAAVEVPAEDEHAEGRLVHWDAHERDEAVPGPDAPVEAEVVPGGAVAGLGLFGE